MPIAKGTLKSETVEMIQTRLAELGYYGGEIHGNLDEETVKAVKAFQHHHDLAEDVIANPETWQQLFCLDERQDGYAFADILARELFEISLSRKRRLQIPKEIRPKGSGVVDAHEAQLVALALSGGGIRSATFNLGVLQAFGELKLLRLFDYLSTVSGGGYIGSWLSALIRRESSLTSVEGEIAPDLSDSNVPRHPVKNEEQTRRESAAISFLRRYTNYITPKTGLFSADTWSVVSTYSRNLCLNLTILSAILFGLLIIPRLLVRGLTPFKEPPYLVFVPSIFLPLILLLLSVSLLIITLNLVSSSAPKTPRSRFYVRQRWILGLVVLPFLVASLLLSYMLSTIPAVNDLPWKYWTFGGAAAYVLLWVLCWSVGQFSQWSQAKVLERKSAVRDGTPQSLLPQDQSGEQRALKKAVWLSAPLAGFFGGVLMWGCAGLLGRLYNGVSGLWSVVSLGPPLMILVFSAIVALHIGLMGRDFPEDKREWWSRLGGWLLIAMVVWLVWFGLAIYGPLVLESEFLKDWAKWCLTSGWLVSTIAGVIAAKSSEAGKPGARNWVEMVALITPGVFIVGLFVMLSVLAGWILNEWILNKFFTEFLLNYRCDYSSSSNSPDSLTSCYFYMMNLTLDGELLLWLFLGFSLLAGALSLRIDINEFSIHHLYRNRLTRCYLGASNRSRRKQLQPFTGFCAEDDLRLKELAPSEPRKDGMIYSGPYLIINAALNLVAGKELAWQERKASSFVFTPRFCGYDLPAIHAGLSDSGEDADRQPAGCYRPTISFANHEGGISLGTAMAISGAAASPNMGYHSSPSLAFLLTVFNVRLGWWAGNPAQSKWMKPGPRFGLKYLVEELFGLANSDSNFVYLSDGGHFENLGIYELVKRRCHFIVACDASQDGAFTFDDLGNAIRKCNADLGIEIEIDVSPIRPQGDSSHSLRHCAIGVIHYERVDSQAAPGTLVYLKPSLTGDEPSDLVNYHSGHPKFPHQTTADQWFDESQFESYRKLGYHTASSVFKEVVEKLRRTNQWRSDIDPEVLLSELRQYWYPSSSDARAAFTRHAQALDGILERIRKDENLKFLDTQICPEWESLTRHVKDNDRKAPEWWLPAGYDELRSGFYLCNSVIQLMENVYLDLNLEQDHDHPDNRGWMNLFRHWSWSGMFRVSWAISACNFGARFQGFCQRYLGLEFGRVEVGQRFSVKETDESVLNFLERQLLHALMERNEALKEEEVIIVPLKLVLLPPRQEETEKIEFAFGFVVLDGAKNILYFRVRDHLRKMGFARLALKELIQSGIVTGIDLKELAGDAPEVPSHQDRSRFERLFQSVSSERQYSG